MPIDPVTKGLPFIDAGTVVATLVDVADLVVDKVFEGGRKGHAGDDRLSKMLGVSNQGGFRYLGTPEDLKLVVVTSSFNDLDWPDNIDPESGIFTYFGDNKKPGQELHATPRFGNKLLRNIFENLHSSPQRRDKIPPILVFKNTGTYRDVLFLGLAVPGVQGTDGTSDLVAIWKTTQGKRFQNYKAQFTILDVPVLTRAWLDDIQQGRALTPNCPSNWKQWIETGAYKPLTAPRTRTVRTKAQQIPTDEWGLNLIKRVHSTFATNPHGFEHFAAYLVKLMDPNFVSFEVTRPTKDGGRDAIGQYRIGSNVNGILLDCAIEAKCYALDNAVGVKELSRLISRLRHRQFGILVTTSYLHLQAYQEIKDDGHPIIILAAVDIVGVIRRTDQETQQELLKKLRTTSVL